MATSYLLLGSFDDGFEQVRSEVSRKKPTISLQASYAYVCCELDRMDAMKGKGGNSEAMLTHNCPS